MRTGKRVMRLGDLRALAVHAIGMGANVERRCLRSGHATQVDWDIAGGCTQPVSIELVALPTTTEGFMGQEPPLGMAMHMRCRKCQSCLQTRSAMWAHRAKEELLASPRTWFGTLTLSPEEHMRVEYRARLRWKARGTVYDTLPQHEQFRLRHAVISVELTKWIKRVRKQSGARLRYILVAEAHKSGLPHYHCLIHERLDSNPIRKRVLDGQWKLGFSQFRLVTDPRAARYVCKYLSKAAEARVRASLHYGRYNLEVKGTPDGVARVETSPFESHANQFSVSDCVQQLSETEQ